VAHVVPISNDYFCVFSLSNVRENGNAVANFVVPNCIFHRSDSKHCHIEYNLVFKDNEWAIVCPKEAETEIDKV
jgi:hypothetical protein